VAGRIHITEAGIVDSVELERSSGSVELDEIALSGARRLAYQPAKQGDQAVAVWAVLPIRFERSTGSVAAQER
jgi:protein TonB